MVGVTGTADAADRPTAPELPSLDGPIPALFCAAGIALTVVGAVPWIAVTSGADGVQWPIRLLAVVALLVGVFVVLVGIGLFRARSTLRTAVAGSSPDGHGADLPAAVCADHVACAGCDASCALNELRA
jgi:hypothetical protein